MNKAMLEIPVPESCYECLCCYGSKRGGYNCRAAGLFVCGYSSRRHPDCPLKIVSSCALADKTADVKCRGYQKSEVDDESAKECMNCEKNEFHEGGS